MRIRHYVCVTVFACSVSIAPQVLAQDPPSTQPSQRVPTTQASGRDRPAARPQGGEQQRGGRQPAGQTGQVLEGIRAAAMSVQPNEQQAQRIEEVLAAARQELAEVMPRLRDLPPQQQRQEIQGITQGVVEDVAGVLTPEQRPAFRDELERLRQQQQQRRQGQNPPGAPGQPPGGGPPRPGQYIEQLAAALQQLELNDEQRRQVDEALAVLREDVRRLAEEARQNANDPQALAQASRRRMEEFRQTLEGILTPEQMQQLGAEMERRSQRAREGNAQPGDRPQGNRPPEGRRGGQPDMAMDGQRGPGQDQPGQPNRSAFLDRLSAPPGLAVGETLEESVHVVSLTNKQRPLREMIPRSKPLVVFLGSASSPTFRDRLPDFFSLRQQIARDADMLIIYTREQHAAGEWTVERNEVDGVSIAQHPDIETRIAAARTLRQEGELRIEIMVDTMDDSALKALVGEAAHCAALVFAPDGRLVGRQQWLDPTGLPALVTEARQGMRESARAPDGE